LDQVARVLVENPTLQVSIEGHTDNKGSRKKNIRLSRDRAASILNFLVKRGIAPDRLKSEGYADEKPIAANDTEEGRAKNRRVEFTIINK